MLPAKWCKQNNLYYEAETKTLFTSTPLSEKIKNEMEFLLGGVHKVTIIPKENLQEKLSDLGEKIAHSSFELANSNKIFDEKAANDPVVFLNKLISDAIENRASDIHLEPSENTVRIRFRIFGSLIEYNSYTPDQHCSVIARLKIMSDLDIAETRRPLDGNIRVTNSQRQVDIRLSTMPTRYGEKAVMRLLDKSRLKLDLNDLGFNSKQLLSIHKALKYKNGIIICSGPTGSGKTTTLYSMLTALNRPEVNILTIEDPIEYELEGINQTQVNTSINLTFASALRSFLRQDPDIIMVGEIRDEETTEIALRAAMTGHLVLTTLHTNTPEAARQRLIDLGGSPFIIDDTLRLVIGQELMPVYKENQIVGRKIKANLKDISGITKSTKEKMRTQSRK